MHVRAVELQLFSRLTYTIGFASGRHNYSLIYGVGEEDRNKVVFLAYIWPGHVVRIMVIDFGDLTYRHALSPVVCNIGFNITALLV